MATLMTFDLGGREAKMWLFCALMLLFAVLAEPASAQTLNLMTFNVRFANERDGEDYWDKRRDMAFRMIRAEAPDIMGTQEVLFRQRQELDRALTEFGSVGVGRDDGKAAGEHCVIFYRKARLTLKQSGTFWLSDTPEVPGSKSWGNRITRICTWARLQDKKTGKGFVVYNVHLDHESQPSREKSITLIFERIRKRGNSDPVILMGDLNAGEGNPAVIAVRAETDVIMRDTFRVVEPTAHEVGTFHAFRGGKTGEKIDYIFVDYDFSVLKAAIVHTNEGGRTPSDHFPVTAKVQLNTL